MNPSQNSVKSCYEFPHRVGEERLNMYRDRYKY